jgi:hypothetical protein
MLENKATTNNVSKPKRDVSKLASSLRVNLLRRKQKKAQVSSSVKQAQEPKREGQS